MVEIADITDRESLEAWLEDQPREVAVAIAARAAARVLPLWWGWSRTEAAREAERGRYIDLTALPVLRSCLISSVAALCPNDDTNVGYAAFDAGFSFDAGDAAFPFVDASAKAAAARAAASAAGATAAAQAAAATVVAHAKANAVRAVVGADPESWEAIGRDVVTLLRGGDVYATPLWSDMDNPARHLWTPIARDLAADPVWSFWVRWYQSLLDGAPMPLPLLRDIALIGPEVWDAGPGEVNSAIAEIFQKHELLDEARGLLEAWAPVKAQTASAAHRGHNQSPEGLVDTPVQVVRELTIIWGGVEAAATELEKPAPDKSRLAEIARAILGALGKVAAYCAELGDVALKKAAEELGTTGTKWAVRAAAASLAAQNEGVQAFAVRLLDWATKAVN